MNIPDNIKGTKAGILLAFRAQLAEWPWAKAPGGEAKLEAFVAAAKRTLDGGNEIDREGHGWQRACELNGIFSRKDKTLKALWALPSGEGY